MAIVIDSNIVNEFELLKGNQIENIAQSKRCIR